MLAAPNLSTCNMGDADRRAATVGLGPFAHEAAALWQPGVMLAPDIAPAGPAALLVATWPVRFVHAYASRLLDGLWPFRPRIVVQRLFWLGLCLAAALISRAYPTAAAPDDDAPTSATASITKAFTVGVLKQHCSHVPAALDHAFIDATSGFVLVLALATLLVVQGVLFSWLERGVACIRRIMQEKAKQETDVLEQGDAFKLAADAIRKEERQKTGEDMRARDQAFLFLVQVLCGCNALGSYFAAAPTGGSMCHAAHVGLAVFYKPLSFPLWYCLLVLLDTSGVRLRHTLMTDVLAWVVQVLFAAWGLVCGALSLPLLVVFPMFGLLFAAPAWLFSKVKEEELELVQERSGDYKDEWDKLSESEQAAHLGTEQLFLRLRGYSVFAALVFGIKLWTFYQTGDWLGTLSDAGGALGASMPVWDLPTLTLTLRWPTELSLPEQLPLFVSAGFTCVELLLKAWRWASQRCGQSAADEVAWRVDWMDKRERSLLPLSVQSGAQAAEDVVSGAAIKRGSTSGSRKVVL